MIGLQQTIELAEQNTQLMFEAQQHALDLQRDATEAYLDAAEDVADEFDDFDPTDTFDAFDVISETSE